MKHAAVRAAFALLFACAGVAAGAPRADPSHGLADLVPQNAKNRTIHKQPPDADALATWRVRILAVASTENTRGLIGPKTKLVDLHGRRVPPGFYDSHV